MRGAVVVALLALALLAVPTAASADLGPRTATHHELPSASSVGSLTASAPSPVEVGQSIGLHATISGFPGYAACGIPTVTYILTNFLGVPSLVGQSQITSPQPNGTWVVAWTAEYGTWEYNATLTSPSCAPATAGPVTITVSNGTSVPGPFGIPGWLYTIFQTTYDDLATLVNQGLATPIANIAVAIGSDIADLEAPWGAALASQGILGPTALVLGLLSTVTVCYAILASVGAVKSALGY